MARDLTARERAVLLAMLLLFVDDDRLSYLELAPLDDDLFTDFPPVDAIDFAG